MADRPRPDDLAPIYARLAAQDAELATQRAEIARLERRRRLPRRALPLLLAALLVALVPLVTLAANPFTDLNPGSPHNGNIDAIYNAGITTGCDPGVAYCPNGNVTREEMASFLARTAGLGGNPPIANALTATSAGNANTVGGYAPSGLVRVARGVGTIYPTTVPLSMAPTTAGTIALTAPAPGFVLVSGTVSILNTVGTGEAHVTLQDAGSAQVSPYQVAIVGTPAGFNLAESVNVTWVFTVSAAGPLEYQLQAREVVGDNLTAFNATLTALYIPFGSTGAGTLGVDDPAPQDGGGAVTP